MRALERRRRLQGYEEEGGAHHRFPRLRRVGDDVCALLAVPLGEVSTVYALYARRAAALFAAKDSDRCGRPFDESLSAASSRTQCFESGCRALAFAIKAIAAVRSVTLTELLPAGEESSFMKNPALCDSVAYGYLRNAFFEPERA